MMSPGPTTCCWVVRPMMSSGLREGLSCLCRPLAKPWAKYSLFAPIKAGRTQQSRAQSRAGAAAAYSGCSAAATRRTGAPSTPLHSARPAEHGEWSAGPGSPPEPEIWPFQGAPALYRGRRRRPMRARTGTSNQCTRGAELPQASTSRQTLIRFPTASRKSCESCESCEAQAGAQKVLLNSVPTCCWWPVEWTLVEP